jgi:hypothetical protein
MAAAQFEINAMQALADRTGLPLVKWHVLRRRASVAALTGSFDSFRRLAAQAAAVAAGSEDATARFTQFGQSVCLALVRGDPADLTPGWTDYLDDLAGFPPVAHAGLAAALMLAGRCDEGEGALPAADRRHSRDEAKRGGRLAHLPGRTRSRPG